MGKLSGSANEPDYFKKGIMEYNVARIRHISHEVKNQLSICDLYAEIITKYCVKNDISDETILNSVKSIKNALIMAGNSMLELKSTYSFELSEWNLAELLSEAVELAKVYGLKKGVGVNLGVNNGVNLGADVTTDDKVIVSVDKNIFIGVIINLIKNACEAFENEKEKNVNVSCKLEDKKVKIIVSNNAKPIENPDKIFEEGVTTKASGSGLGLYISKTNIEKMSGKLRLLKSDSVSTDFEIELNVI